MILLIIATAANQAYSQISPVTQQVNVNATVISHSLVVYKRDLNFGDDLIPGISKSVNVESENSGMFEIRGKKNKSIKISFILPDVLNNGSNTMSISFSDRDGGYEKKEGNMKLFDPRKGLNAKLNKDGELDLYLGGTVTLSLNQASGFYSAPIVISILYDAN